MEEAAQPLYEDIYSEFDWAKDLADRIRAEAE